jgi:hypothetical protein
VKLTTWTRKRAEVLGTTENVDIATGQIRLHDGINHIITDYDSILRSKAARKYFAALEWSQPFSAPYAHCQNPAENYMKKTKDHVGSFDGSVAEKEQARQRAERKHSDEKRSRKGGGNQQRRKQRQREHFDQGRFRPGRRGKQLRLHWEKQGEGAKRKGKQKSGSNAGGAEEHDAMDVDKPPQPSMASTTAGGAQP